MHNKAIYIFILLVILVVAIGLIFKPEPLAFWTAILALATFLIAFVAIFEDTIKNWLGFRPELVLTLYDPEGKTANDTNDSSAPEEKWSRYYHLRLINKKKRWPATSVRVMMIRILKPDASGKFVDIENWHGPLTLNWQFAQLHPIYERVGVDLICDLGRLRKGEGFELIPILSVAPFYGNLKSAGKMQVIVQAIGDDVESNRLSIQIHWDGNWSNIDAQMAIYLVVKEFDGADL